MSRKISVVVAVLCVIAFFTVLISSVAIGFMPRAVELHPFVPGERPEGDALAIEMPDDDDATGHIKLTAQLYNLACRNYQQSENACFMVKSSTLMFGSINVEGHRYCVKNGDKRYYLEYSFVDGELGVAGDLVGAFDTRFVTARYTDESMDVMVDHHAACNDEFAPSYTIDEDNGDYIYEADWEAIGVKTTEMEKPIYASYQSGTYQHTDHCVSVDTILSATVTYNAEEGYYHCEFTLDTDKVPESLLASLRTSSGANDATYTNLKQEMDVWDNGYFRFYRAIDSWSGKMGGKLPLSSVLDFSTTYYYEEKYMDIDNYQFMKDMCKPEISLVRAQD